MQKIVFLRYKLTIKIMTTTTTPSLRPNHWVDWTMLSIIAIIAISAYLGHAPWHYATVVILATIYCGMKLNQEEE